MPETPFQILEVRAAAGATITAAVSADAGEAIFTALSEQLDRRRHQPLVGVDEVLELRQDSALTARFQALAAAGAHAVVRFTADELRNCLLGITGYADRVDGEHFQPVELRERLAVISEVVPVLWDANARAAAAVECALAHP